MRDHSTLPSTLPNTTWEIDWTHPGNTGTHVWARNPKSHLKVSRVWHLTSLGTLRDVGFKTPIYRKDAWEIDWNRRNGKKVWGRNTQSKMAEARSWHWIDHKTLDVAGVAWRPLQRDIAPRKNSDGYIVIGKRLLTEEERELCRDEISYRMRGTILEHRLVALKKYGKLPKGIVVRHLNGIKSDNDPGNIVLGTTQENYADHNTARLRMLEWRERALNAERIISALLDGISA